MMIGGEARTIHRGLYVGSRLVLPLPLVDEKLSVVSDIILSTVVGLHMLVVYRL